MAGTLLVLSLTASLNPTLLAITSLLLLRDRPAGMMVGFLAGGLTVSVSLGIAIVLAFNSLHPSAKTTQHTLNPAIDILLGALLLLLAAVLHSEGYGRRADRHRQRKQEKAEGKGPPRWQRALNRGTGRTAFVLGMLFTLPGASYIAALAQIHKHNPPAAEVVLLVIAINLIMLWIIEVPLLGFLLARRPPRGP
jgi:threonine/homoserine/homoserine lactone efflux protein